MIFYENVIIIIGNFNVLLIFHSNSDQHCTRQAKKLSHDLLLTYHVIPPTLKWCAALTSSCDYIVILILITKSKILSMKIL